MSIEVGKLITGDAKRDAIHVAVAPVVANEKLYAGQPIGFVASSQIRVGAMSNGIGIVDPFLREPVYPDQVFWMFLYPGSVSDLRHDWSHPAFLPADAVAGKPASVTDVKRAYYEVVSKELDISTEEATERLRCSEEGCNY